MTFISIPGKTHTMAWITDIPIIWGFLLVNVLLTALLVWCWRLPRRYIFRGAGHRAAWKDLRIWATIAIIMQYGIYWMF